MTYSQDFVEKVVVGLSVVASGASQLRTYQRNL